MVGDDPLRQIIERLLEIEKRLSRLEVLPEDEAGGAYTHPNHSGEVTSVGDGATTIANNAVTTAKILDANVTNAKLANMTEARIKGRELSSGTGVPVDLTAAQARTLLGTDTLYVGLTGNQSVSGVKTYYDNAGFDAMISIGTQPLTPLARLHVDQPTLSPGTPIPVLLLDQADLSEEFIQFNASVGAGNPIDTAALGSYYGKVRVNVNGSAAKFIPLYNS